MLTLNGLAMPSNANKCFRILYSGFYTLAAYQLLFKEGNGRHYSGAFINLQVLSSRFRFLWLFLTFSSSSVTPNGANS